ncbi:MAG: type II secretion system protein [Bdellovibrionales bacterium]
MRTVNLLFNSRGFTMIEFIVAASISVLVSMLAVSIMSQVTIQKATAEISAAQQDLLSNLRSLLNSPSKCAKFMNVAPIIPNTPMPVDILNSTAPVSIFIHGAPAANENILGGIIKVQDANLVARFQEFGADKLNQTSEITIKMYHANIKLRIAAASAPGVTINTLLFPLTIKLNATNQIIECSTTAETADTVIIGPLVCPTDKRLVMVYLGTTDYQPTWKCQ